MINQTLRRTPARVPSRVYGESGVEQPSGEGRNVPAYIPTPAQIRAECMAIQSGWSETERRRRSGWPGEPSRHRVLRMLHVNSIPGVRDA
jgi:hypothetical protein